MIVVFNSYVKLQEANSCFISPSANIHQHQGNLHWPSSIGLLPLPFRPISFLWPKMVDTVLAQTTWKKQVTDMTRPLS